MTRTISICAVILTLLLPAVLQAADPDYSQWNRILSAYYEPARGMDYAALKARDAAALQKLRRDLGAVNAGALSPQERLAYWINVYNINTAATIVEKYPVKSIRDLSTDPIVKLNVFKKARVPSGSGLLSLNDVENDRIRKVFNDPRIHFAINCAAKSCPPLRKEAYTGAKLDAQLDSQSAAFLTGPLGATFELKGTTLNARVTKIMDWFGDDFKAGGGVGAFLRRYVSPANRNLFEKAKTVRFSYAPYDWSLNDWKR